MGMGEMRRGFATSCRAAARSRLAAALLAVAALTAVAAAPARGAAGYELDASTPELSLGEEGPHGIAVDQASRRVYVAIVVSNPNNGAPGRIARFESDLTAAGSFAAAGDTYYTGVAVNPVTQGFFAAQALLHTPFGDFGTPQMDVFSSAGVAGSSFALSDTGTLPQIATDSSGDVYYPNALTNSVQVFDSSGALQEEIGCGGCPGGSFDKPVSVALNSEDDLYVVDLAPDRVVELTSSGGPYTFESTLQSGRGAAAVGVDPGTDDVLVGDLPNGRNYHIVAYDSSGTQFDDFGAGLFTDPDPQFGALVAAQIAVDATSHKVYVGDAGKLHIFERVATIDPPTATIEAATGVGQITAELNATVNANGHAALECDFEYTDDADFQANGFSNAATEPCPVLPDGSSGTPLTIELSSLPAATEFHYRLTVASNAGSETSGTETFETLPVVPPTVTAEPPAAVTQTAATLKASVNPHGGSVSDCHFELGTSTAYGTNLPCPALPGPATTDVAQSRKASGLSPSTTYHYRLVVTSNAGTAEGDDVEFSTDDPPSPEPDDDSDSDDTSSAPPPALAPPLAIAPPPAPRPLRCGRAFRKKWVRGKARCVRRCRRGFRQKRVRGKVRCLNKCRRGFRKTTIRRKARPRRVVRCVKKKRGTKRQRRRSGRRRH